MATQQELNQIELALRDWRHWVGNDMLDHLDVEDAEGARDVRFRRRLALVSDDAIDTLQRFFELGQYNRSGGVWGPGLKLFVSHVAGSVQTLLPLTEALKRYGIHPFLAHQAINPMQHWHEVLIDALNTMDALLSFHAEDFRASPWCGQEVGFALGRGVTVVPMRAGEDPSGFIAQIQAVGWHPQDVPRTVASVIEGLKHRPQSKVALGDALARELKFSGSFARSDFLVKELASCDPLSETARDDIQLGLLLNDQVRGKTSAEALIEDQDDAA
jgi:hypothetical protein